MEFTITRIKIAPETRNSRKGEPYKEHPKIYISPEMGEGSTVLDMIYTRYTHEYTLYKKTVLPAIFTKIFETETLLKVFQDRISKSYPSVSFAEVMAEFSTPKNWRWRQNCGCSSCPCSPGFIFTSPKYFYYFSIYVTVNFSKPTDNE